MNRTLCPMWAPLLCALLLLGSPAFAIRIDTLALKQQALTGNMQALEQMCQFSFRSYVNIPNTAEFAALKAKKGQEAFEWAHHAAAAKHPGGYFHLALCYTSGIGCQLDNAQAMLYLDKAVAARHTGAITFKGICHWQGLNGYAKDPQQAAKWLKKGALAQEPLACALVGRAMLEGNAMFAKHTAKGVRYLQQASAQQEVRAYLPLAKAYEQGYVKGYPAGSPQALDKAEALLQLAVDAKQVEAMYALGMLHLHRATISEKDADHKRYIARARISLFMATRYGHVDADYAYSCIEVLDPADEAEALRGQKVLQRLAAEGHYKSAWMLAKVYDGAIAQPYIPHSPAQALHYYKVAKQLNPTYVAQQCTASKLSLCE